MSGNRNERLAADYYEMMKIQDRPYLSWIVTKGEPPYAEEYLLSVKLRTYVLSADRGRYTVSAVNKRVIRVTLWDSYPEVAPYVRMLSIPPVFHPDWYSKGTYCPPEKWSRESSLKDYVKRMLTTLTYEPSLIETDAPANYKALEWYMKRRDGSSLFPCDETELSESGPEELDAARRAAEAIGEAVDSWGTR